MSTQATAAVSDPAEFLAVYNQRIVADGAADMNEPIIADFRASGGPTGLFAGAPILLLTATGARSGRSHTAPLAYTREGERYIVAASRAGASVDPAWYRNLVADPRVTVELGTETFEAVASWFGEGPDRDRLFAEHVDGLPDALAALMRQYERQTSRRFPVVVLERAQ